MKPITLLLALLFLSTIIVYGQKNDEEKEVKAIINLLFDGMRNADTTMIRKSFSAKNIMQTIAASKDASKDGKFIVKTENVDNFIISIATPHPEKYDERIAFTKILIDANLASVWTTYKFYIGEKFSHCGVNSFQLFKGEDGWKIIYLIDTRRKENCN